MPELPGRSIFDDRECGVDESLRVWMRKGACRSPRAPESAEDCPSDDHRSCVGVFVRSKLPRQDLGEHLLEMLDQLVRPRAQGWGFGNQPGPHDLPVTVLSRLLHGQYCLPDPAHRRVVRCGRLQSIAEAGNRVGVIAEDDILLGWKVPEKCSGRDARPGGDRCHGRVLEPVLGEKGERGCLDILTGSVPLPLPERAGGRYVAHERSIQERGVVCHIGIQLIFVTE